MLRFNRFSLVSRLVTLAALTLAATFIALAAALHQEWQAYQVARHELTGLPAAKALLGLLGRTAEHRGLSAGYLAGNDAFAERRAGKQREVEAALAEVHTHTAAWADGHLALLRSAVHEGWRGLAPAVAERRLAPPDSFGQHNRLVRMQLDLLEEVVSRSTLALDPEVASYWLVMATLHSMPEAAELTGQLRGFGAGMLARSEFQPADRLFVSQTVARLRQQADRAFVQLKRAAAADPQRDAEAAVAATAELARKALIEAPTPAMAGAAWFDEISRAVAAQHALAEAAFTQLDGMLTARAAAARHRLLAMALLGLLAFAGAALLARSMVRSIRASSQAAIRAAEHMAEGQFDHAAQAEGDDEFARIVRALDRTRLHIATALHEVRSGVDTIATASTQIAQGSADLSRRTESQASALQQTAASMEQIAGTVNHSSDSARQAAGLAAQAREAATQGGEVVRAMVQTMGAIGESSQRIGAITGVIDSLAFQTNILALNAAVEAARAGEHGRGFAVVAAEVRQLAQKSAEAAREIKQTIASSGDCVQAGRGLAGDAGERIDGIVHRVRGMAALIDEIAAASGEQSRGVGQVNAAVAQMDHGTQQNSALAEESAAAAESLRTQAARLAEAVARFRLAAA
jgi:methyl-accepting chemotaxis protein